MTDRVYRIPSFTYTRTTEGVLDKNKTNLLTMIHKGIFKISLILLLILSHS